MTTRVLFIDGSDHVKLVFTHGGGTVRGVLTGGARSVHDAAFHTTLGEILMTLPGEGTWEILDTNGGFLEMRVPTTALPMLTPMQ